MSDITRTRPNADQMDLLISSVNAIGDAIANGGNGGFIGGLLTEANYKTVMKKWFMQKGAASMTDFTALCDQWYLITRTGWTGGVKFLLPQENVTQSSDGVKTGDNAELTCTPSTTTVKNTDDYAGIPLFFPIDVNVELDSNGEPHITAIDGICGAFERYNTAKIVGVMQMTGWIRYYEDGTYYGFEYTDAIGAAGFYPLPEAVKLSDNTVRTWVVHGKYGFGEGWTCCSGQRVKVFNVSHNTQLTGIRTAWSNRYCGATSADDAFMKLMLYLKYGTLDSDRVLHGCCGYNLDYTPALAETGVERVLITTAQAANVLVGSTMHLSTTARGGTVVADRVQVVSVETVEIEGTSYGAVYVDNGGVTFDTDTTQHFCSLQWFTGTTDAVLGNDGGINPANDRYPVKIQGIEYMVGCYEVMGDTILSFADVDGVACQIANVCRDATKLSTSVTSDYIQSNHGVPRPAAAGWVYAKRLGHDPDLPEIMIPSVAGASSSSGTRDGFYEEADTATGLREWLRFGRLGLGVGNAGLSCGSGDSGLGGAYWGLGGRLSVTGNRGEFQAAA